MSYPPLVVGVRHAGNRALRNAFGLNSHRHPDHYDLKAQLKRHDTLLVPLREPLSIAISWYRRPRGKHTKFIVDEFALLERASDTAKRVHYVTMDRVRWRKQQLESIAREHNLPLVDPGKPPYKPIFLTPEVVLALYERVRPVYDYHFVSAYYPDFGEPDLREVIDTLAGERRMMDPFGCMHAVYDIETGRQKR